MLEVVIAAIVLSNIAHECGQARLYYINTPSEQGNASTPHCGHTHYASCVVPDELIARLALSSLAPFSSVCREPCVRLSACVPGAGKSEPCVRLTACAPGAGKSAARKMMQYFRDPYRLVAVCQLALMVCLYLCTSLQASRLAALPPCCLAFSPAPRATLALDSAWRASGRRRW